MKIFENSFLFFSKKYALLISVLLCLIAIGGFFSLKLKFDNDISKTFSTQENFEELNKILTRKNVVNKIIFAVEFNDTVDADAKIEMLDQFSTEIQQTSNNTIYNFRYKDTNDLAFYFDYFQVNLPYFYSEEAASYLSSINNTDSLRELMQGNYDMLTSESSFVFRDIITKDPLHLTAKQLQNSTRNLPQNKVDLESGLFLNDDGNPQFTADFKFNFLDSKDAIEAKKILDGVISNFEKKYGVEIEYFSGFLITISNSTTIERDAKLTLIIGLGSILLLLIIYYRSLLIPVFFVIPGIFGALFSLASIYLIQGQISVISVGTGAVVIGIILDFSFHFFTHFKKTNSLQETIKEVSTPLIIGSLTTILAFGALIFTSSPILQDFGLFTSLSLLGSIAFILLFFPAFLSKFKFRFKENARFSFSIPQQLKKVLAGLSVVAAILFFPDVFKIEFDDKLRNLNYQDGELVELEEKLISIEPEKTARIFTVSKNPDVQEALESYERVNTLLKSKISDSTIEKYVNVAPFIPSIKTQQKNYERWLSFVEKNGDSLKSQIFNLGESVGINGNAFQDFYTILKANNKGFQTNELLLSNFNALIDTSEEVSFLSIVDVPQSNLAQLKKELNQLPDVSVVDRSEVSKNMVKSVQNDFNYILLVSTILVFFTLLFLYGRIELAMVTFIPMIVSWIIICGIAVMVGIKFNFVNIVVTTFIFGLGDDFAIFITDAYLKLNKTGKRVIESYNTSIFLSALSTILATGVLILADHPAMKSIALISVIGLVTIFIVSQTLQPILLEWMITNRTKKGKQAWTFFTFFSTIFVFSHFLLGCALLFVLFGILLILPFPKRYKQKAYRHVFRLFCLSIIYVMFPVSKKHIGKENKRFDTPKIIIVNHTSFLDILLMVMQSPKLVILTNDWVYKSPIFGAQIRFAGYLQASKGVEENIEAIKKLVANGCSVVIFPEGSRSTDGKIKRFHKGAFFLAQELKLPIQPVFIHGANYIMSKGDFMMKTGKISIKYLPEIQYNDSSYGESYQEKTKAISKYYKAEFLKLREELETPKYFYNEISKAYIYTSPRIENYVKIKYRLEQKFFEKTLNFINTNGLIYDLGCGYGYVPMLIKLKYQEANIIGIDFDEDKIEIAENNVLNQGKSTVEFFSQDIRETVLNDCSTIILGDVIHYLPDSDKRTFLSKCVDSLIPSGRLIIREGIQYDENHNKTAKTEVYSTKILNFNKTDGEISFIGRELIDWLIQEKKLTLVEEMNSTKNSNSLFIFERN